MRLFVDDICQDQWDVADSAVCVDADELRAHRGRPLAKCASHLLFRAFPGERHRAQTETLAHSFLFLWLLFARSKNHKFKKVTNVYFAPCFVDIDFLTTLTLLHLATNVQRTAHAVLCFAPL